jgi:murein DD-endopeptidase MepM/ murein hydrolase activator NlpD
MRRLTAIALLSAMSALVHAAGGLPRDLRVPGGVAVIALGPVTDASRKPDARFDNQPVLVLAHDREWKAVIGLPLTLPPGQHRLHTDAGGTARGLEFAVSSKHYPVQHLTIKDKRKVEPLPEDMARIEKDSAEIDRAFRHWSDTAPTDLRLELPSRGRLSSNFGLKRVLNGQPRASHTGLDIAAPVGTPVVAPAPGRVIAIGDYFFTGNTVFLDHGQGLITMYIHLDSIAVTAGEQVSRGQRLGEIGLTGRTTGAHLHWAVSLNNARVDPALFLDAGVSAATAAPAARADASTRTGP